MEVLILLCLIIIIIILLVKDKVTLNLPTKKQQPQRKTNPKLPSIIGQPKPLRDLAPTLSSLNGTEAEQATPERSELDIELDPSEIMDDPPSAGNDEAVDLQEEEEDWHDAADPEIEEDFASGLPFDELTKTGEHLQQEQLTQAEQRQVSEVLNKTAGTDLYELLQEYMRNSSPSIRALFDQDSIAGHENHTASSKKTDAANFDIDQFL